MTDLLLDPAIRSWVFVPIIVTTFLIGIIRHFAYLLLLNKKKTDLNGVKDSHYLAKTRLLRENGKYLPANSFGMRKSFLADDEHGYLPKRIEKQTGQQNPLDPSMISEMLKGNMLNMIPMIFIGGWINWTFSGFVTTKVPFPLTLRFKPMLQRGVDLASLDAAWVSSASWYFLNVFGLRSIYNLVLGGDNVADTVMDEQAQGNMNMPGDPKQAFKAEWEALQVMVKPLIYVLVAIFGSSSWLSINSVWLELSLLTQKLPEGWSLPSYLTLTIQLACIAPLIYTLLLKCAKVSISVPPVIFVLMLVCTIAEFLMAFFWDQTYEVFGDRHSVILMVLLFVMAMVNATSNVLFMPYMADFHSSYLTAYFVGMGLSSLIPSVISLAQGTSQYTCIFNDLTHAKEPVFTPARFQVREYTLMMGVWMSITLVAFCMLHVLHYHLADSTPNQTEHESSPLRGDRAEKKPNIDVDEERSGFRRYCILLACLAFVCAQMNAVVPSIQSFATLSYSQLAFHLALALSSLSHPVASFLPMWIQPRRLRSFIILTLVATVFCGIIVFLALQSPTPIGRGTVFGSIFTVVISIITAFLHSYLRTVLTTVLREDAPNNESRLFWCGLFMQIGSFVGSGVMFPLVNVVKLFESAPLC